MIGKLSLLVALLPMTLNCARAQPYEVEWDRMMKDPTSGTVYAVGKGQALLSTELVLTGGPVVTVAGDILMIGHTEFRLTKATRFCGGNGKRTPASTINRGLSVLVTSKVGGSEALTVRVGGLLRSTANNEIAQNYLCT